MIAMVSLTSPYRETLISLLKKRSLQLGDFTLSLIMRATTEQVNGVWQGACYPFREGLSTGILDVHFTPDGNLLSGGTNRG